MITFWTLVFSGSIIKNSEFLSFNISFTSEVKYSSYNPLYITSCHLKVDTVKYGFILSRLFNSLNSVVSSVVLLSKLEPGIFAVNNNKSLNFLIFSSCDSSSIEEVFSSRFCKISFLDSW